MELLDLKEYFLSDEFKENYIYNDNDLGITYTKEKTIFKIWAPTASYVKLRLFSTGTDNEANSRKINEYDMSYYDHGVWIKEVVGDLNKVYYDFQLNIDEQIIISADPYAIACGANGNRSMVIDMNNTNPIGWKKDSYGTKKIDCPIIYELHIKDFSYDKASGIDDKFRGKYLAFTQRGTTLNNNKINKTGIDYLQDLGITHVQLLPTFDYGSVDEEKEDSQFNWGYDPLNYNVPEGSYSSNAFDGEVRIKEFKEMILALHKAGIKVIMDVVYNHTFSLDSWFQRTVPYYYYRLNKDGSISNGSACSNDTASEREMFRNYMRNSVIHWVKEYHIDGFRFDLMGLHDVETMNIIRKDLNELENGENLLMYGEPWAADSSNMDNAIPALKENVHYLDSQIGIFCDDTRDAIKGHVFYGEEPGFVNGGKELEKDIQSSVMGWADKNSSWCPKSSSQIISYVSAHDNFTLYDKLVETMRENKDFNKYDEYLLKVNKLVAVIVFTCQGSVFFQAGEEFARTKQGEDNSFNLSPQLNKLDWTRAYKYEDLINYYKGLIRLRKKLKSFYNRNNNNSEVTFEPIIHSGVVCYRLKNNNGDIFNSLFIVYNSSDIEEEVKIPEGKWNLLLDENNSDYSAENIKIENRIIVNSKSAVILGRYKNI